MKKMTKRMLSVTIAFIMMIGIIVASHFNLNNMTIANADTSGSWAWPTSNHTLKSDWPNYASGKYHGGTDFSIPLNSPVYSTCDGEVVAVTSLTTSYGKHIKIRATVDNQTVYMRYCHLNGFNVKVGDKVSAGQQIAVSGSTGNSTGPHLHYEVRNANDTYNPNLNPREYLPGSSKRFQTNQNGNRSPKLWLDEVSGGQGVITVKGWAYDEDNLGKSLDIHVYMDNDNKWVGSTTCQFADDEGLKAVIGPASSYYHRFSATFSTSERGAHRVNIAALDDSGGNAAWSGHDIVIGDTVNLGDSFVAQIQNANNGKYLLASANDDNVLLYAKNGNEWVSSNKITWHFKRNSDGSYHIMSYYNGKYLDAYGAQDKDGANICTHVYGADDAAERWFIISDGGSYKLRPSFSGSKVVDVTGNSNADGTNIQLHESNGSGAQNFKINIIQDIQKPYIESVKISDISLTGYKVTITAKDNVGIKEVKVPTWTQKNGQDDLVWHVASQVNATTWTYTVKTSAHKNEYGIYYTDVYAYDYFDNFYACNSETTKRRSTVKVGMYTVKFEPEGGAVDPTSKTVVYNSTYGSLPSAARSGYEFKGWHTAKSGGTAVKSDTKVTIKADQTLYAQWKVKETTTTAATTKATTTTTTTTTTTQTTTVPSKLKVSKTELTLSNGAQYEIKANQANLTYKTNNAEVAVVSKKGIITAVGEGNAVISVINPDSDVVQIKVTVISAVPAGDCNNDGEITVTDVIMLQRWLLSDGTKLSNRQAADLHKDGSINAFDLAMLKHKLLDSAPSIQLVLRESIHSILS